MNKPHQQFRFATDQLREQDIPQVVDDQITVIAQQLGDDESLIETKRTVRFVSRLGKTLITAEIGGPNPIRPQLEKAWEQVRWNYPLLQAAVEIGVPLRIEVT